VAVESEVKAYALKDLKRFATINTSPNPNGIFSVLQKDHLVTIATLGVQ
jgi:hypothetical protein